MGSDNCGTLFKVIDILIPLSTSEPSVRREGYAR